MSNLNKPLYAAILSATIVASASNIAYGDTADHHFTKDMSLFVGIDTGRSRVEMQRPFGEKIFRKNATFYNLFAGLDFNQYFGVELGYQRDNTRRDRQSLVTGDIVMGDIPVPNIGSPFVFDTYLRLKNRYFGITAQYPVYKNLYFSVLFGVSNTVVKAEHTLESVNGLATTQAQKNNFLLVRTYKKSKYVPVMRFGTKYKFHEHFSLRANVTWIGMSRIRINSDQNGQPRPNLIIPDTAPNYKVRFKNSLQYSIGVTASLF